MNIKILVCYHKKDPLYKNDVLVPIHCGRTVAKQKHKEGQINDADYQWLLNNMIGDNTGDNISELNREVNEMTAIYWAWKNYDKLGNPDYIGLCHYRRLFNFSGYQIHGKETNLPKKLGLNKATISRILEKSDFIVRNPIKSWDLILENWTAFQLVAGLSNKYHPNLFNAGKIFMKKRDYYCNSMFIMKREDFFAYCSEIFPVMFDFLGNKKRCDDFLDAIHKTVSADVLRNFDDGRIWLPRLTGFFMEYISGLYFLHMMKTHSFAEIPCTNTEEIHKRKILKNILSVTRKKYNDADWRVLVLFGSTIKLKRISK